MIDVECEIWIPAARPDVIGVDNVDRLSTRLVLQGANIPVTPEAETRLHARGLLTIPDFIANAGGVICAAVEYRGGTPKAAFEAIAEKISSTPPRYSRKRSERKFSRAKPRWTWLCSGCAGRCTTVAGRERLAPRISGLVTWVWDTYFLLSRSC